MKTAGFAVLAATLSVSVFAETVKGRKAAVRNDRAAMEKDARWIYNDTERGSSRLVNAINNRLAKPPPAAEG